MYKPVYSTVLSDVFRCQNCWKALYLHENYPAVCRHVAFKEPKLCRQINRRQINYNLILRPHLAFGCILKFSGCLCAKLFLDLIFRIPNYVKKSTFVNHLFEDKINHQGSFRFIFC